MANRREKEQQYSRFYDKLNNFLNRNSGLNIGGVNRWGSRTTGAHRNKSDLDVIFWVVGDPTKRSVYPDLVGKLKSVLKVHADIGDDYNVINIWKEGITCDLVLLTKSGYQKQIKSRRK